MQTPEESQIKRIAGQIGGIEKMIKGNTKASQIIQQIEAVKGSLSTLEKRFLTKKVRNLGNSELEKMLTYILKNSS